MVQTVRALDRTARIVGVLLLIALGLAYLMDSHVMDQHLYSFDRTRWLRVDLYLSTVNSLLLLMLTIRYASLYRKIQSRYLVVPVLFGVFLTLFGLTSNPALPIELGYTSSSAWKPFSVVPKLLVSVGALALLSQTECSGG